LNHLLGFFRENGEILPVFSESPEFKDHATGHRYCSIIKTLTIDSVQSEWCSLASLYTSHSVLDDIFNRRLILRTSYRDEPTEPIAGLVCGVLMHAPINELLMCRTGVLVVQGDGGWSPVVVRYRGVPYIVECKGVGSGIGGFCGLHQRSQVGSSNMMHMRVTGGMMAESVQNEFERLMAFNSYYNFEIEAIRPLACILFDCVVNGQSLPMGLLLRLSPSNIRFSYGEFGLFKGHEFKSHSQAYRYFGPINKQLHSAGFRHHNLNSNNLCYVGPNDFVCTDYEEIDSIYRVPESLDVDTESDPPYSRVYPFRYLFTRDFPSIQHYVENDKAVNEVNSHFLMSQDHLRRYALGTRDFLGDAYFRMDLLDWLTTSLRPMIVQQRCKLKKFSDGDNSEMAAPEYCGNAGSFAMKGNLEHWFLMPYLNGSILKSSVLPTPYNARRGIACLDSILRQMDDVVETNNLYCVDAWYHTPFMEMGSIPDYWDLKLLMFPFLYWVCHWRYFLCSNDIFSINAAPLVDRLASDLRNAEGLYVAFRQSSDDFVRYLTQYDE
jgi:hypothetical protein